MESRVAPIPERGENHTKPPGTAVITGAAGGLGAAFARSLSGQGYDLFLTDQDAEALDVLTGEIRQERRVQVASAAADLTREADIRGLQLQLAAMDGLAVLVNNAGFGTYSLFHQADLARQLDMVRVHVIATMRFCHAVLPGMIARHRGTIINVASAGAFTRFPMDATYIGSKSFLVAFTECLALELAGTGVAVQSLCPGWVQTGFNASPDYATVGYRSPIPRWLYTSPERVVSSSLRTVGKGPVTHIPTIRARIAISLIGSRLGLAVLARIRKRRRMTNAS